MNNYRIIKELINQFIVNTSSKFKSYIFICLNVIPIDQERKIENKGKKLIKKKKKKNTL